MAMQYAKEELWKLFEKLPQELKEAVFSQDTADSIFNACERNGVEEVSRVAYFAGLVLMGALLPTDFQKTLQDELKLEESTAKTVAAEINRFVFYPVKPALEQLHSMPASGGEIGKKVEVKTAPAAGELETPAASVAPTAPPKEDVYKEPIE